MTARGLRALLDPGRLAQDPPEVIDVFGRPRGIFDPHEVRAVEHRRLVRHRGSDAQSGHQLVDVIESPPWLRDHHAHGAPPPEVHATAG